MRSRDRESAKGLLPRMEARPRKDGLTTYRYHPVGLKPQNLGTDRLKAIQRVLDMLGIADDRGTIARLWEQYQDSLAWRALKPRTRSDYEDYSVHLLKVFGNEFASAITAPDVARYLRVYRADAPIRANREIALLGNLIGLAIERGEATANPCRGGLVKRNREVPLDVLPESADIEALVRFAAARDDAVKTKIGRSTVIMLAAEFAALTGARQAEFLPLHWPAFAEDEVRLERAKQHLGVKKVDRIAVSPALAALRARLLAFQTSPMGAVFPNRAGNIYTASGFASMWQKIITAALAEGAITQRFNFHALRAFYATQHKTNTGNLPDMHASPTTTAKIYERSKTGRRSAL
jgi:site-specific recombinase XerD